jgi:flagellar biosynthesis/type III secretory pathway protein FliH
MTTFEPFRFERDFAAEEEAGRPSLPEDPLEIARRRAVAEARRGVEAELAKAREKAFADGLARGREQARQEVRGEIEAATRELLETLRAAVDELVRARAADAAELGQEAARFVGEAVTKLLPGLEARLDADRLQTFMAEVLTGAPEGGGILVQVAPEATGAARAALERLALAGVRPRTLELQPAPGLAAGEVRASWRHGGMTLAPGRVAAAILEHCLGAAPPPAPVARPKRRSTQPRPARPAPTAALLAMDQSA